MKTIAFKLRIFQRRTKGFYFNRIVVCQVMVNTFAETNIEGNLIQQLMQGYER